MKEQFISRSINLIRNNNNYSEEDYEKIRYGLEGIYLTITKLIIILAISFVIGITKELILVLIFFNIIRFPAFGVHADKSITCLIVSLTLILGLTFIVYKTMELNNITMIIISLISFINYPLFAPADTVKRPLTNKKKRLYRKIGSCIIAIIYVVVPLFINKSIGSAIFISLILESIMINPLMYKALNMPFNNYKKC